MEYDRDNSHISSTQRTEEEIEESCQIDLKALQSFLETVKEEPSPSTNIAFIKIQEALQLNHEAALPLISIQHVDSIIDHIPVPEIMNEALITLSLIQTFTQEFTNIFESSKFIEIVLSIIPEIEPKELHALSSLLSNILIDNPNFIEILVESQILQQISSITHIKQSSETKRFISICLTNEKLPIDLFTDLLNSQTIFLKEHIILENESYQGEDIQSEIDEQKEEELHKRFIRNITRKYPILHSFEFIFREFQKKQCFAEKCQRLCQYMLNSDLMRYFIVISHLQIVPISVTCLRILYYCFKDDSTAATTLLSLNILEDLKSLINSHFPEINLAAMEFVPLVIMTFPDISREGFACFTELDYASRFRDGNFTTKNSILRLLISIIQDFDEEDKRNLFSPQFIGELIDILDIENEKLRVYTLFARLFATSNECNWIFEILDEFDFWSKVEDDHFNTDDENLSQITSDIMKMHEIPTIISEQK